jgi:hypothetical protein
MPQSDIQGGRGEFTIRVASIDELFASFDASPVAERALSEEARLYILDKWEQVRATRPTSLTIRAPASERATTDEAAVADAVHAGLQAFTGRYRDAVSISRLERIGGWVGTIIFLATIAISVTLDRLTGDVLVAGVSQAIVVIGWVALWAPAQRLVVDAVPHRLARGRYAELAKLRVRLAWEPSPG